MLSKNDISQIRGVVREEIRPISKKIDKVVKKLDEMDNFLDQENLKTLKRVKRIEHHLNLPPVSEV